MYINLVIYFQRFSFARQFVKTGNLHTTAGLFDAQNTEKSKPILIFFYFTAILNFIQHNYFGLFYTKLFYSIHTHYSTNKLFLCHPLLIITLSLHVCLLFLHYTYIWYFLSQNNP